MSTPGKVTVSHGTGTVTSEDRAAIAELATLEQTQLDRVRAAAEGWRNGQAALLGLIATVSVVKGPDAINDLPTTWQVIVGVLLLGALLAATAGVTFAIRAVYGDPKVEKIDDDLTTWLKRTKRQQLTRAISDLRAGRRLTYVTLALLTGAIAVSWYATPAPPSSVKLQTATGTTCGTLQAGTGQVLVLKTATGFKTLPIAVVESIKVVDSCG